MENRKKETMIVEEDNTIYEIDLECVMRKKREKEEKKREKEEKKREKEEKKRQALEERKDSPKGSW